MNIKTKFICVSLFVLLFSSFVFSRNEKIDTLGIEVIALHNNVDSLTKVIEQRDTTVAENERRIKSLEKQLDRISKLSKSTDNNGFDWELAFVWILLLWGIGYLILKNKLLDKITNYIKVIKEKVTDNSLEIEPQKTNSKNNPALEDFNNSKPLEIINKIPFVRKDNNLSKWLVIGQSVIGKSHTQNNTVCQDSYFIEDFGDNWGIAISCDGAGSAKNSQIGSKFVSEHAAKIFRAIVEQRNFLKQDSLPVKTVWQDLAKRGLYQTYQDLEVYSKKEGLRIESLACTVIIVIYSPFGYLVTHIGDGRAGYLNEQNEWKSLMTPWKGEEANQTVFITSSIWNEKIDDFIESNVIETEPRAFTLMSDGCENHSFECSKMNPETKEWSDPNLPFPKFFNPLMGYLVKSKKDGKSNDEINTEWSKFISEGTPGLKNESDDKTLILGILQPIQ